MKKEDIYGTIAVVFVILFLISISLRDIPNLHETKEYRTMQAEQQKINLILDEEKTAESVNELKLALNDYFVKDAETFYLRENNEMYFLEGTNDKAILLIHGLGASPGELRELGEFLNKQGYSVFGARVEGHGDGITYLESTKWEDWYDSVEFSYNTLSYMYDDVHVVGISTGASLAILLSKKHSLSNVKSLVVIAPPIYMRNKLAIFAPMLKYFKRYIDRERPDELKSLYNDVLPSESIAQLYEMIKYEKECLIRIDTPILIMQATEDPTVDPRSSKYVYNHIGSKHKEIKWIEDNFHVTPLGKHKEEVFHSILNFISNFS